MFDIFYINLTVFSHSPIVCFKHINILCLLTRINLQTLIKLTMFYKTLICIRKKFNELRSLKGTVFYTFSKWVGVGLV